MLYKDKGSAFVLRVEERSSTNDDADTNNDYAESHSVPPDDQAEAVTIVSL